MNGTFVPLGVAEGAEPPPDDDSDDDGWMTPDEYDDDEPSNPALITPRPRPRPRPTEPTNPPLIQLEGQQEASEGEAKFDLGAISSDASMLMRGAKKLGSLFSQVIDKLVIGDVVPENLFTATQDEINAALERGQISDDKAADMTDVLTQAIAAQFEEYSYKFVSAEEEDEDEPPVEPPPLLPLNKKWEYIDRSLYERFDAGERLKLAKYQHAQDFDVNVNDVRRNKFVLNEDASAFMKWRDVEAALKSGEYVIDRNHWQIVPIDDLTQDEWDVLTARGAKAPPPPKKPPTPIKTPAKKPPGVSEGVKPPPQQLGSPPPKVSPTSSRGSQRGQSPLPREKAPRVVEDEQPEYKDPADKFIDKSEYQHIKNSQARLSSGRKSAANLMMEAYRQQTGTQRRITQDTFIRNERDTQYLKWNTVHKSLGTGDWVIVRSGREWRMVKRGSLSAGDQKAIDTRAARLRRQAMLDIGKKSR